MAFPVLTDLITQRPFYPSRREFGNDASYHTLPLTRENLGLVSGEMPQQPTPSGSTTSRFSKKTTQSSKIQGISIQDIMRFNGMPIEDKVAKQTAEFR